MHLHRATVYPGSGRNRSARGFVHASSQSHLNLIVVIMMSSMVFMLVGHDRLYDGHERTVCKLGITSWFFSVTIIRDFAFSWFHDTYNNWWLFITVYSSVVWFFYISIYWFYLCRGIIDF